MNIYQDIAERTNGDIYIGVVGPVRTGKSTFVTKFMESIILPNIKDKNSRKRAQDELPQSADGKTIMTSQPKFVPNEAVKVTLEGKMDVNVRLIDCVGYLVEGAQGLLENDKARLIKTPWSEQSMTFDKAAEIGTRKVVNEHSTIAVVVTNDGSITEIERKNFVPAEQRVVGELKELGKPFVIVLNSRTPKSELTENLATSLREKYNVNVIPLDVLNAQKSDFEKVLIAVLGEFAINKITVSIPRWLQTLDKSHWLIDNILLNVKKGSAGLTKMKESELLLNAFSETDDIFLPKVDSIEMGKGVINYKIDAKPELFFKILTEQAGNEIKDEYTLMSYVSGCSYAKKQYDGLKKALLEAQETGYGIVAPSAEEMTLLEPEIIKSGTKFGVKLKATAPCLHIMRVDVATEVNPMVGTEQQSQYLLSAFQSNPKAIWETNMFGKSISSLAQEGIMEKCEAIPDEARNKLVRTVGRIINEGRGGLICLLL
ncbi:MAG: stage IV sporulation protein A [Clostridia bacterium]